MKDQIKVGDVWVDKNDSSIHREILMVTDISVFYRNSKNNHEYAYSFSDFLACNTLKKPEAKLRKLVAWTYEENDEYTRSASINMEDASFSSKWTKKEIIIKDGALYVEE